MNMLETKIKNISSQIKTPWDLKNIETELLTMFDEEAMDIKMKDLNADVDSLEDVSELSEEYVLTEVSRILHVSLIDLLMLPSENIEGLKKDVRIREENIIGYKIIELFEKHLKPCLKDADANVDWTDVTCKFLTLVAMS